MTWTCIKCHRTLRREPVMLEGKPFGPVCAQTVAGRKAKRARVKILYIARASSNDRQMNLELV